MTLSFEEFLKIYSTIIFHWQKHLNLFSKSITQEELQHRHFDDITIPIQDSLDTFKSVQRIDDLGSGAGLPGLILAHYFPHAEIHLWERHEKKALFLNEATKKLSLHNVMIHNDNIDEKSISEIASSTQLFTSRAAIPKETLLPWILKNPESRWYLWVGQHTTVSWWQQQLQQSEKKYSIQNYTLRLDRKLGFSILTLL